MFSEKSPSSSLPTIVYRSNALNRRRVPSPKSSLVHCNMPFLLSTRHGKMTRVPTTATWSSGSIANCCSSPNVVTNAIAGIIISSKPNAANVESRENVFDAGIFALVVFPVVCVFFYEWADMTFETEWTRLIWWSRRKTKTTGGCRSNLLAIRAMCLCCFALYVYVCYKRLIRISAAK